jgi:hypothetical protein
VLTLVRRYSMQHKRPPAGKDLLRFYVEVNEATTEWAHAG